MFGVKHKIVVLLIYVPWEVPNLPNLHLIPYYSFGYSPGVGIGCQNPLSSSAIT